MKNETHREANHTELGINFGIGIGVFIVLAITARLYRTFVLDEKEKQRQNNNHETQKIVINETFEEIQ